MQKVNSFAVDHKKLEPGIYATNVNGAITYDIRIIAPRNCKAAPSGEILHTLEHFLASYLREVVSVDFSSTVLYVGPMGCKTGFYLLTSVFWSEETIRKLLLECCNFILCLDYIPGASEVSCGNPTFFDLAATKEFIVDVIVPSFNKPDIETSYPLIKQ